MAKSTVAGFNNLDLENDVLAIKKGDYRDALDITLLSDGNGNTLSAEPVLGNLFSDSMGFVNEQFKIVRISLAVGSGSYSLIFKRLNYITIATVSIAQNASAATTVNNAITAITGAISDATITGFDINNVTVDVAINPADISFAWDWTVFNNSSVIAGFTTIQEAIDPASAGQFKPIGSFDLLGDLFKWGATASDIPSSLSIVSVANNGGLVQLEVPNHGLTDGAAILVKGLVDGAGNSLAGEWIVQLVFDTFGVFDANHIILFGSTYNAAYTLSNAAITVNPYSVGCITVCQEDVVANTITSYSLIKSKALNLRVKKQVDTYVENDSKKKNLYFTDGFNPIRVLYYTGAYSNDGFLADYSYGTLGEESRLLIQDQNLTLSYNSTATGTGQLKSGNYRYAVRLVTANESASSWTELSNVINLYAGPSLVGDADGTVTNKANILDVAGIPTGLFKYIELGYVIYQGTADIALLALRSVITGPTMQLTHTGFGTETEIDLGTLNSVSADYETALSLDVLNNKMILSNLTTRQIIDFSAFAQTLTHSLEQELIPNVGVSTVSPYDHYRFGEYFDTQSTYHKKTLVHNETYRYAMSIKLKNGPKLDNQFWIDDICINTSANNNLADPFSNRRTAGLPNFNLIDTGGTENVYIAKVVFGNIDWNYTIDGVRLIDLVERIYINQVEMTSQYKEVLGTGLCVYFARVSENVTPTGTDFSGNPMNCQLPSGWVNPNLLGEFNWFSQNSQTVNGTAAFQFPNNYNDARVDKTEGIKYVSFYSPDEYFGNESFNFQSGDVILQKVDAKRNIIITNPIEQSYDQNAFKGVYEELLGSTGGAAYVSTPLTEVQLVGQGGQATFGSGFTASKTSFIGWEDSNTVLYTSNWFAPTSPVCYAAGGFASSATGHQYGQYYRNKGYYIKFGPKNESKYVPTGSYIDAPIIGQVSTVTVYGDSFTQSSFYKLRSPENGSTPFDNPPVPNHFYKNGWGFQTMFYSQNRVNSQMRNPITGIANSIAPYHSIDNSNNSALFDSASTAYTLSYTVRNQVNVLPAYDPNALDNTKFPTRIAYSQTKPNGSVTDEYRDFKPLDFRDLDMGAGEIVHHEISNGELLTWQQRSFQRQYFNDTGMLTSADGSEVILGDGGALTRRGLQLSSLGTPHKWSIVKGVSKGGNDVMSWWNTEYGYVVRFGYDGVNPISYVHNINGFIDKNTKWANIRFTPADDEGIRGVWNDERKEYVWTVRARRTNKERFNLSKYYNQGDSVFAYQGLSQVPVIYKALQSTARNLAGTITSTDVTDTNYWAVDELKSDRNEYTLAFSEFKNGFSCYYSFLPLFYARWRKGYQSNSPYFAYNIYNHNRGEYSRWYDGLVQSIPYLTAVVNDYPNDKKSFNAIELNSLTKPSSVGNAFEFFTEQHSSYLVFADFDSDELHDILYSSWIKNDATVTAENPNGVNDVDTSELFGEYLLAKYNFTPQEYNKLFGFTISWQARSRSNAS